jgi:error-prone DNA polymerase
MYAELACKSNFSFLRGASDAREYIHRAKELGIAAVGIADSNGVYGLPRAHEALKENPGVKLLCGAELTIAAHPPLTLLARTRPAYGALCRILTKAHAGKEKGEAALTFPELIGELGHEGAGGLVALPALAEEANFELLSSLFPGRTYVPLCRYLDGLDRERTMLARRIAGRFGIAIAASNDVHYHIPARRPLQDCLACIREGATLATAGFRIFGNEERYLKSPLEMRALFQDLPEAIRATLEIAESCAFQLSELRYQYPREFIPPGHSSQSYLEECVSREAAKVYRGLVPAKLDAQLRHELALIAKLGYADYFLTIRDIVEFAKGSDILCQGRGSAANSAVCYVLGITAVDPLKANLLFERFLSEDRAEPPDIDVDFEHERREEVIQYIYRRYGRDRAAMVAAVRTYQRRSAFLELSKAIGVNVGTISADALAGDFAVHAGALGEKRPVVEALAEELHGFPRHLSIHSGGFVLSEVPICETVPIEPARMENRTIIQWDKNDLETLGLMKVDILALGFLTALQKVSRLTGRDWRDIPHGDEPTYRMIQRAETEGTFQIESRAQRQMLVRSLPENFYDLVVQVALVRPGPSVGKMVHPYLQRREKARRGEKFAIPDPVVAEILGRTYGVPVFQEQVMRLAISKAGFSAGEADQLRRSLGGWRSAHAVSDMGRRLYDGLVRNGMSRAYADELFGYFQGYTAYNFPESHSASFASIAYKSAYFKCHYPPEFLCGLVNSQPMGFYPVDMLVNEFQRQGVTVLPVHPNESEWDATMTRERAVRMGFRNVQGAREEDVRRMMAARPFTGLQDFVVRNRFSREVIEAMALGDVFHCFGLDQRHSFWSSLEFGAMFRAGEGQGLLFEEARAMRQAEAIFSPMTLSEEIRADYRSLSYSLRGHIMKGIRQENTELPPLTSKDLKQEKHGKNFSYAGVLTALQRPPTAKGVAFITLEDEHGTVDIVVKKEVFEAYQALIRGSRFLIVEGRLQRQGTGLSLVARKFLVFGEGKLRRPNVPGGHPRSYRPE